MPLDSTNYVETKPDTQVVTDLLAARQRIVECGWFKMNPHHREGAAYGKGASCAASALLVIEGADVVRRRQTAHAALGATLDIHGRIALWNWNDAPGRTRADVLNLYDRTIARLRAQS